MKAIISQLNNLGFYKKIIYKSILFLLIVMKQEEKISSFVTKSYYKLIIVN